MGKTLQFVLRVTRMIAIAVCSLVLVASLVMWPRSLFYLDHVRIPFTKGQFPLVKTAGGLPGGTVVGGYPCFNSTAGRLAIVGTGPHPGGDSLSSMQHHDVNKTLAIRAPYTLWSPYFYPSRPAFLLPYWLIALTAILGLLCCFPSKALVWVSPSISDVLYVTFVVALIITASKLLGHADAVIIGETFVLALIAMKSLKFTKRSTEQRSYVELLVGGFAVVGLLAAVAFATFTHVSYKTWFEPVTDLL